VCTEWLFVPTSPAIRAVFLLTLSKHLSAAAALPPPRLQLIAPRHAEPALSTVAAFRQPSPVRRLDRVRQQHDNRRFLERRVCSPTTAASHSPACLFSPAPHCSQAQAHRRPSRSLLRRLVEDLVSSEPNHHQRPALFAAGIASVRSTPLCASPPCVSPSLSRAVRLCGRSGGLITAHRTQAP
jgi:hypothetical protein